MNLAISTLAIVLAILPGMVFFHAYYASQLTKRIFGFSPLSELAQYIIFAVPVNGLAIFLFGKLPGGPTLIEKLWAVTVEGGIGPAQELLRDHGWWLFLWYLGLLTLAAALGWLLREFVWASKLDLLVDFLRPRHAWYYQLRGRGHGLSKYAVTFADVLTELGGEEGGTRIYRGAVVNFNIDKDGGLRDLVLAGALRGKGRGAAFEWKDIPGDEIVLIGPAVHSINLQYVEIEAQQPDRAAARFWRPIRRVLEWLLSKIPG